LIFAAMKFDPAESNRENVRGAFFAKQKSRPARKTGRLQL
jgi:hypothetical protein